MVLLTPIQLTATEYLEQPISMTPVTPYTDATPLPADPLTDLGIHSICRGIMHLIPVSMTTTVVACYLCEFRIFVPSLGLNTYGDLRAATPVPDAPTLDAVLNVGNTALTKDILIAAARQIDAAVAAGVLKIGTTNAGALSVGTPSGGPSTFQVFINQGGASFISNAGLQLSSTVANRGSCRMNQFGANAGVPGITGFKSRGANVGTLASCVAGDVLFRATAIGIPADNASFPLAGWLGIQVPAGGVGANYLASEFEVRLTPLAGPINGHKQTFLVGSDGKLHGREAANCFAGVAVLGAAGTVVVGNTQVTATTKFNLTAQDGGPPPTGVIYQAARVPGVSFTIASAAGAADAGVQVYYQLWEPTAP